MSADDNKAFVRHAWEEVLNNKNVAAYTAYFACGSPEALIGFLASFPDASITYEEQVAEDDRVASRVTYRGTHQGEFMSLAPTGKAMALTSMAFDHVADGKIVDHKSQADWLGLLQQLGARAIP